MGFTMTKYDITLIIDALQFTSCGDVCSDIKQGKQMDMARLSAILAEEASYKSKDNYYHPNLLHDQEDTLEIVKPYIRNVDDNELTECEYCGKMFTEDEAYKGISWMYACAECGEEQKNNYIE